MIHASVTQEMNSEKHNSMLNMAISKTDEEIQENTNLIGIEKSVQCKCSGNSLHRNICHRKSAHRKKPRRVVTKCGHYNIENPKRSKYRVFPDIVAAFIEARWRWTLLYCIFTYVSIWLLFAVIWWIILYFHGDFELNHLPRASNSTVWTPCVKEIYSFTSIFLFSIEVYSTIGYGTRTITLECPLAILTMCIESIIGTIIQSFIVGIIFAKLRRPKNRAQTLLFSKNAVVHQRDGTLCMIFRVGNTRKSRILSVNVQAYIIRFMKQELHEQISLNLSVDTNELASFIFHIVLKMDENSPLYSMSARDIKKSDLEILVVFEGIIESTGQLVQVKSSYTANEILWGHRFAQMIHYKSDTHGFVIDYQKFDETNPVKKYPLPRNVSVEQMFQNL